MDGQYHIVDLLPFVTLGKNQFDACLIAESIV